MFLMQIYPVHTPIAYMEGCRLCGYEAPESLKMNVLPCNRNLSLGVCVPWAGAVFHSIVLPQTQTAQAAGGNLPDLKVL